MTDPGEGPESPLFLDQTEAQRAKKTFGDPPFSNGLDDRSPPLPPPNIMVWIRHCNSDI